MLRTNKAVIGLDLSLKSTGVCVIKNEYEFVSYTIGRGLSKASESEKIERLNDIGDEVIKIAEQHEVAAYGVEGFAFGKAFRAAQLGELHGAVKMKIFEHCKQVVHPIPPLSLRKYLLEKVPGGSVNQKKAVRKKLFDRFQTSFKNYDESDAGAVALVIFEWSNRDRTTLAQRQLDVLHRLDDNQTLGRKAVAGHK